MKMLRNLLLIFFCFIAPSSVLGSVEIRSGEHGSFTRLVFYLDSASEEWDIQVIGSILRVANRREEAQPLFDFSSVFDFIPKTRVSDIYLAPRGLEIMLACKCDIASFPYREDVIVVDIIDLADGHPEYKGITAVNDYKNEVHANKEYDFPSAKVVPLPKPYSNEEPSIISFQGDEDSTYANASADLLRKISGNLSAGILSPAPRRLSTAGASLIEHGVAVSGALDRDKILSESQGRGANCPSDRVLSFFIDDKALSFPSIGAAQVSLATEASFPTDEAVIRLASAYIEIGFGAEATQILASYPTADGSRDVLSLIAALVDEPDGPAPLFPVGYIECGGPIAVWSFIAASPSQLDRYQYDGNEILRVFSGFPPVLRAHLAPTVARKFKGIGKEEEAAMVHAAAGRTLNSIASRAIESGSESTILGSRQDISQSPGGWETHLAAAHFGTEAYALIKSGPLNIEDRIFIESAIKDAPDAATKLEGIALYVQSLLKGQAFASSISYLDHLMDTRSFSLGALTPYLDLALEAAADSASDGEILALSVSLATRDWFPDLQAHGKEALLSKVSDIRREIGLDEKMVQAVKPSGLEVDSAGASAVPPIDVVLQDAPFGGVNDLPIGSPLDELLTSSAEAAGAADDLRERMRAVLDSW